MKVRIYANEENARRFLKSEANLVTVRDASDEVVGYVVIPAGKYAEMEAQVAKDHPGCVLC